MKKSNSRMSAIMAPYSKAVLMRTIRDAMRKIQGTNEDVVSIDIFAGKIGYDSRWYAPMSSREAIWRLENALSLVETLPRSWAGMGVYVTPETVEVSVSSTDMAADDFICWCVHKRIEFSVEVSYFNGNMVRHITTEPIRGCAMMHHSMERMK